MVRAPGTLYGVARGPRRCGPQYLAALRTSGTGVAHRGWCRGMVAATPATAHPLLVLSVLSDSPRADSLDRLAEARLDDGLANSRLEYQCELRDVRCQEENEEHDQDLGPDGASNPA